MSSASGIQLVCGFEGGMYYQFAENGGVPSASDWSTVTPVSPESGVAQGSYALFHENAGGGMRRSFNPTTIGAVGFMWRPETVPFISGGISAHIVGLDAGSLGGFALGWDTATKLNICSQSNADVYKTGGTNYAVDSNYWIWMMAIDAPAGAIYMVWIHDFTAGVVNTAPLEVIYASEANGDFSELNDSAVDDIRLGQTAGSSTAGWYIDNIVVTKVANISPALGISVLGPGDPTVSAVGTTGSSVWITGDGGNNDSTEPGYIDSIPADHSSSTQYIRDLTSSFPTIDWQSYDFANGVGSGNILGVGVWAEQWTKNTTFMWHRLGLRATARINSLNFPSTNLEGWEYTAFFASELDPDGNDWTTALVDAVEVTHGGLMFGSSKEVRVSQIFAEVAFALKDNRYEFIVNESGYAITAVGGRRIFIT